MTDSVSSTLSTDETLFQRLVWNPTVQAGLTALYAAQPWTAVWPIQPIIQGIVGMFSGFLFNAVRLITDIVDLQLTSSAHQATYDSASEQLAIIIDEQGINSDAYKTAEAAALAALAQFTHFNS